MGAITQGTEVVIEALKATHGNVYRAALRLDTSRKTLHAYINAHPTVASALADIRESTKDDAELMLYDRMRTSDTLLIFYLKTQAKDRGYVERSEHTGTDGGPMEAAVVIYMPDNGRDNAKADGD